MENQVNTVIVSLKDYNTLRDFVREIEDGNVVVVPGLVYQSNSVYFSPSGCCGSSGSYGYETRYITTSEALEEIKLVVEKLEKEKTDLLNTINSLNETIRDLQNPPKPPRRRFFDKWY